MKPDSTHAESIADALSRRDDVRSLHLFDDHAPSIVIDPGVVELRALERIHIGSNRSTDFDIVGIEALASVPTLRELSLNVNARVALPSAVFDLRRLERLHLRGPWASLPESLGSLGGLRHLDLSMHALTALPDSIGSLRQLRVLSVRGCRLAQLPSSIGELEALVDLFAEGNRLRALPSSIVNLRALERLLLGANALVSVPTDLATLPKLTLLDLVGNPALATVPPELALREGLRLEIESEKLPQPARDEVLGASSHAFASLEAAARTLEREAWTLVVEPGEGTTTQATLGCAMFLRADEDTPRCGICDAPMSPWMQLDLAETSAPDGLLQLWGCDAAPSVERLRAIADTDSRCVQDVYRAHLRAFFACVPEPHWEGMVERARAWNTTEADRARIAATRTSGNALEYTLRFSCRELASFPDRTDLHARIIDRPTPEDLAAHRESSPTESGPRPHRIVSLAPCKDRPTLHDLGSDDAWAQYRALTEARRRIVLGWTIPGEKIGGWPRWLSDEDWGTCATCGCPMTRLVASIGGNSGGSFGPQLEGAHLYMLACDAHPRALALRLQGG